MTGILHLFFGLFEEVVETFAIFHQGLAGGRQLYFAWGAAEERRAEFFFQAFDPGRNITLYRKDRCGGFGKAAMAGYRFEDAEVVGIHLS